MRRFAVLAVTSAALLLPACTSDSGKGDPLQVVENPVAATPAPSPKRTAKPAGAVVAADGKATAVAVQPKSRLLALAVTDSGGSSVLLFDLDDLGAEPKRLSVAGPVERLAPDRGGEFVGTVPSQDLIVYLSAEGVVGETQLEGGPVSVIDHDQRRLVALREAKAVGVLEYEQRTKTISGELQSADQVLAAGEAVVVLDRLRSALFEIDVAEGSVGVGLRAGDGATNAVTDRYGRVLVTDTRTGALLAFSANPLVLRQRFPVPGGIYGIAYDSRRDLAWVTLTARNEVVAFDVAGGEPQEKMRFVTVRQPNSVTVDESTGRVIVASAAGEGLQVIEP